MTNPTEALLEAIAREEHLASEARDTNAARDAERAQMHDQVAMLYRAQLGAITRRTA